MRVYIAGPIAGYPDQNRMAFSLAASRLLAMGHDPVNPQDIPTKHDGSCLGDVVPRLEGEAEHRYGCYMVPDLHALLDCEGYTLLPGWERSRGASIEEKVAQICGKIYDSRWMI